MPAVVSGFTTTLGFALINSSTRSTSHKRSGTGIDEPTTKAQIARVRAAFVTVYTFVQDIFPTVYTLDSKVHTVGAVFVTNVYTVTRAAARVYTVGTFSS